MWCRVWYNQPLPSLAFIDVNDLKGAAELKSLGSPALIYTYVCGEEYHTVGSSRLHGLKFLKKISHHSRQIKEYDFHGKFNISRFSQQRNIHLPFHMEVFTIPYDSMFWYITSQNKIIKTPLCQPTVLLFATITLKSKHHVLLLLSSLLSSSFPER